MNEEESQPQERLLKIAKRAEFDNQRFKRVTLLGKKVGIFKDSQGQFTALEMTCKHQGADLTVGKIKGQLVTCPRHGWQYDLTTGQCVNKDSPPLRPYKVVVEGDDIYISPRPIGS